MSDIDAFKKHSPERKRAARSIKQARYLERERGDELYTNTRGGAWYILELRGLRALFKYVRSLQSRVVLDVGAGVFNAVNDLSQSKYGEELEFRATFLGKPKNINIDTEGQASKVSVYRTSVETLHGVEDMSVGCILGSYSIAYSEPTLAVASIDRVLVPGGVLKATFAKKGDSQMGYGIRFWETKEFAELLRKRGYDVKEVPHLPGRGLILAIKPGGKATTTAGKLYVLDAMSAHSQQKALEQEATPSKV